MEPTNLTKVLMTNPKIFYNPPILFHGTSKTNAETIQKSGLKTHDGYSTVTLNPNVAYALYGKREMSHGNDLDRNENEGVVLVIEPCLNVGPGTNANIFLTKENVIDGYPAEWVKGNLGVFLSSSYKVDASKELLLPSANIVAVLPVNSEMDELFSKLKTYSIYSSETEVNEAIEIISKYLTNNSKYFRENTDYNNLATSIYTGVLSSQIIEHLRRTILGYLLDAGYLIARMGSVSTSIKIVDEKRIVSFMVEGKNKPSTLSLPTTSKVQKNIDNLGDIYPGIELIRDYVEVCKSFLISSILV